MKKAWLALALLLFAVGCTAAGESARVLQVVDGDTIEVGELVQKHMRQ